MTVIGALRDDLNECTWLGYNDQAQLGDLAAPGRDEKWFLKGNWVVGVSGYGPRNEVVASLKGDFHTDEGAVLELVKALRAEYDEWGVEEDDNGVKRFCGDGLIAHKDGGFWDHDGAFALSKIPSGSFWARGSGDTLAIGAAAALIDRGAPAEEVVFGAIGVAIRFDTGCPGEPRLLRLDKNGALEEVEIA